LGTVVIQQLFGLTAASRGSVIFEPPDAAVGPRC